MIILSGIKRTTTLSSSVSSINQSHASLQIPSVHHVGSFTAGVLETLSLTLLGLAE